jgi:hypothetical protein
MWVVLHMATVKFNFKDNRVEVEGAMSTALHNAVLEASAELVSQTARNTAVDTGQLKGSWAANVTESEDGCTAVIGSPLENAIWEEFGTGEYALEGNGRKGGWFYVDEKGDGHFTHGKHPRRPFWKAYNSLKNKLIKHMQEIFKEGMT